MKKAILTVIGKDQVGIIAGISAELGKLNINILNVNQTIMDGYFTMIMMLDQSNANESFDEIKKRLSQKGQDLKVDVKIQREEIFNSMHSL
ncbi:ACT domain-containing protein [Clostridium sp. HCP1S3_B4]|uniref:ACT domain-containing protein n=1 Tax=unclassified Clostridium TaxID=2614128 RepID=UPI0016B607F2|nr:ACT domain-containing protein [Clostridiales bacterium]MDY2728702.1 ACT domain-containing protein [Clostridium sp.]NLK24041.1 ACT domain-containing protein [Clostridiales bacterium]